MSNTKRATAVALVLLALAAASFDYTVERGDTLGGIARDHGVSLRSLIDANDIVDPNLIRPGQVLVIPGTASSAGGDSSGGGSVTAQYKVVPGDSLLRIARSFGVSITSIVEANNIANPNLIRVGQVLTIPGASGGSSSTGGSDQSNGSSGGSVVASVTTYVVQRGDTLGAIAGKFGISVSSIIDANGLANPNLILPGQELVVDATAPKVEAPDRLSSEVWVAPGAGEVAAEAHTVTSGETVAKIASAYGVAISAIVEANGLANANLISVGQVLTIPVGSGWVCPVPGGKFGDTWGAPRSGGRLHEGTDVFAPHGSPVLAPVAGHVTVKTGTIGGIQFTLKGDNGHVYHGTHMAESTATGRVVAGQQVGTVGNTGNAAGTPPHLHFEIHPNGNAVNPYHTLVKACR
jgi:LysM repeat protein